MRTAEQAAIAHDFWAFLRKAFEELEPARDLQELPYLRFLAVELDAVAKGKTRRIIFNLPPRSLKTIVVSVAFTCWLLGRDPTLRISIFCANERLVRDIASKIRVIMKSDFYKGSFHARISKDRFSKSDFGLIQGGGLLIVPINGDYTGRGADIIIIDDPLEISDALRSKHLPEINSKFDTTIQSRLNSPKNGTIIVVGHRIHADDLSGHLIAQGGWKHVRLPLVATRSTRYDLGHKFWRRKKGELLNPYAYTQREVKRLRKHTSLPSFETLYQQRAGSRSAEIRADHFKFFDKWQLPDAGVALSIDPAQLGGDGHSFTVVQAWTSDGRNHFLLEQWRQQAEYVDVVSAIKGFIRRHRPTAVIIENTAQGAALISQFRSRNLNVISATPSGRSKIARLRDHLPTIRAGRIHLAQNAPWICDYVDELASFPNSRFDDQVDATSQFLAYVAHNKEIAKPPMRDLGVKLNALDRVPLEMQGAVLVRRWR